MALSLLRLKVRLVLASRSPRRRQLLEQIGLTPYVHPSSAPELVVPGETPHEMVVRLAEEKAAAVAGLHSHGLVLGADTIVVLEDEILGKPVAPSEAISMLTRLSGRTHAVFTGIALKHPPSGRTRAAFAETFVTFGDLTSLEIERYVATGSPMDKAGAYGIQDDTGALFIERIEGDYYNVVGLPLRTLYRLVTREFSDLLVP